MCEGTGENIYLVRDGVDLHAAADRVDPRRHQPPLGRSRSRATSASRSIERDIARAELYLADEVFVTGTAAELTPIREIDDRDVGDGQPGRGHARGAGRVRGRAARARGALPRVARPGAGGREDVTQNSVPPPTPITELYDATLRDGMGGAGISLTAEEKVRVVRRLDELGIHLIEAGFPASNPKEAELFALLERERLVRSTHRRVRHDPPARRRRRGRRRACARSPSASRR